MKIFLVYKHERVINPVHESSFQTTIAAIELRLEIAALTLHNKLSLIIYTKSIEPDVIT